MISTRFEALSMVFVTLGKVKKLTLYSLLVIKLDVKAKITPYLDTNFYGHKMQALRWAYISV